MKKILILLLILFSNSVVSQSLDTINKFNYEKHYELILEETKNSKSKYYYEKQLKKFNSGEAQTNLEVLTLLIGYTKNKYYNPYVDIFLDKEIYDLNEEKKFKKAIKYGTKVLKKSPFLIKLLRELAYSYEKIGENDLSSIAMTKTGKIYNAMFYSSSSIGIKIDEAIFALNPKDGQYFIKYFLKSKLGNMGSGRDQNGNFIDMLETVFNNNPTVFHFNVEHAIKTIKK